MVFLQVSVIARIVTINAGAQYGDGSAVGTECCFMGGAIDAAREAADDAHSCLRARCCQ